MEQPNAKHRTILTRETTRHLSVCTLSRPRLVRHYVTAVSVPKQTAAIFAEMSAFVQERKATVVLQDVFASRAPQDGDTEPRVQPAAAVHWPVLWLDGAGTQSALQGTQFHAVSAASIEPVVLDGRLVGYAFEDDGARYCLIGALYPRDISGSRQDQVRAVLEQIESVLGSIEMNFCHIVRTWFYVDRILEWYGQFNAVRTGFFGERNLRQHMVPASTGVGGANRWGAALGAKALAIQPKSDRVVAQPVPSPLQCPALNYHSSFSRALEVDMADHRLLYVSGTASIDSVGNTMHVGDAARQIERTLDVVHAILESRRMGWADVVRAVAYFKRMADAPLFDACCRQRGFPPLPLATAHADICRTELLFELELDAVTVTDGMNGLGCTGETAKNI